MRILIIGMAALLTLLTISCSVGKNGHLKSGDDAPVSHAIWDELLKKYVSDDGLVDYKGFVKDRARLGEYTDLLGTVYPNKNWSEAEQLAYWINVYNAFTVQIVVDNYPVESIKDISSALSIPFVNTVWDVKFVKLREETLDLNQVEHGILRTYFEEPRIHFAVNCASGSCPILRKEAFVADKLEAQLEEQTRLFVNDKSRNVITANELQLSKIFSWFKGDFTKQGSLIEFLNRYSDTPIDVNASISHLDYDWTLNE